MPAWLFVMLGLVVVVGGLLAIDWFTAGRVKRRTLMRARDGSATDANVGYGVVERSMNNIQHQNPNP